jgi:hypothetical protein
MGEEKVRSEQEREEPRDKELSPEEMQEITGGSHPEQAEKRP